MQSKPTRKQLTAFVTSKTKRSSNQQPSLEEMQKKMKTQNTCPDDDIMEIDHDSRVTPTNEITLNAANKKQGNTMAPLLQPLPQQQQQPWCQSSFFFIYQMKVMFNQ
ncbi:hypothetical protein ACLKA7_005286 [Drosophila subpalustris]